MKTAHAGFRKYVIVAGRRNTGKSSLLNSIAKQNVALVSEVAGTTTDPVYKTLEVQPIGPVTFVDTPGIDDEGKIGVERVKRAKRAFYRADAAVLVVDDKPTQFEHFVARIFREMRIPFLIAVNKMDLRDGVDGLYDSFKVPVIPISARFNINIDRLLTALSQILPNEKERPLVSHLLKDNKTAVLVIPIDKSAPKGRLIMPQTEAIREILDSGGTAVVTRETELSKTLKILSIDPDIVVTDSQAVMKISSIVPLRVPLTTFSILESAKKADVDLLMMGIESLDKLKAGDFVAVVEACSHVPTCDDIGRVKIPHWIEEKLKLKLTYKFFAGKEFPDSEELKNCKLMIHCGGCVLTRNSFMRRMNLAHRLGIPVVNYGMLISYLHGVLDRVIQPLKKS